MLLSYLTLASKVSEIESVFHVQYMYSFTPEFRFGSGKECSVITNESEKSVVSLPWGVQLNHQRKSRTDWIPVEGILKNPGTRSLIRIHRCIVLTNCFYLKSRGEVLLFYKPSDPVLCLGGIWNIITRPGEPPVSGFALLTRPAPAKLSAFTDRVPVIVSMSRLRGFLNVKKPLMDISWILRESYYPNLQAYTTIPGLLLKDSWTRKDLLPAGEKIFMDNNQPGEQVLNTRNYFWR
jgi:putative SOS response-associated peptidase YedK